MDEVEREEEKERSALASAAPSAAPSPESSPPSRSQSSSPPPSGALKRSFSTANIDASLSLHSLLDQPSSSPTSDLPAIYTSSPPPLTLSTFASSPSLPPHGVQSPLVRQRSRPDARDVEETRQQREWLNSRLKPRIHDVITELIHEVEDSEGYIAAQATEHIYANEVILTYSHSDTVIAFLKTAARLRRFEVMVVETAPSYSGQAMAMKLATSAGDRDPAIDTTVITDSAVYAIMPAVNKCIIGCHAVMANGALIVPAGGFNVALAAHAHAVPLVVLTGLHKLSPLYSHASSQHNIHQSPSQVLSYDTGRGGDGGVRVENPLYEEVSADMVELLIHNYGAHNPSYIYRLLKEHYHAMDLVLRQREDTLGKGRQEEKTADAEEGKGRSIARVSADKAPGAKGKHKTKAKSSSQHQRGGIEEE